MYSLGANPLVKGIDSCCSLSDDSSELESSKFTVVSGSLSFSVEEPLKDKYGEKFLKSCFSFGMERRQSILSYFKPLLARNMDVLVTKLTALTSK